MTLPSNEEDEAAAPRDAADSAPAPTSAAPANTSHASAAPAAAAPDEPQLPPPAAPRAHDLSPGAVKRRLGFNLIANIYNQGVTVAVQLLAIPLFLSAWGVEQYGVWIAINALPWYFYAISDLGFVNLAANDMAMKRARNELAEAIVVFQSTTVVVVVFTVLFAMIAVAGAAVVPFAEWFQIPAKYGDEAITSLMVLLAQLPFVLILGLLNAGFRADGKYAVGALYVGTARLLDGVAPAIVALAGGGLLAAAVSMLCVRFAAVAITLVTLRLHVPWLKIGIARSSRTVIVAMLRPAAAFLAMPLAQVLQITGTTLLVSAVLGPVAVAAFNTIRTLANLAFNAFGIIMNATWFEMSSLLGAGKSDLARQVNRRVANLSFWIALAACAFMAVAGPSILRIWTGGKVQLHAGLFYLQLVSIVIASLWRVSGVVLLATNNHRRYTVSLLIAAVLQLLIAAATLKQFGLTGAGIAMVAMEILMLGTVLRPSLKLLGENGAGFAADVLTPPNPKLFWNALVRHRSFVALRIVP